MSEWGNPSGVNARIAAHESIVRGGETWGTETSKYPQEKKTTVIPQVVVSERGAVQTVPEVTLGCGVADRRERAEPSRMKGWKAQTAEGKSPVCERRGERPVSRVPRGTWNPVGSREDHLPRLNTNWRPIVKQYREGKVKRTPGGE